ncbi:MAG: hypothetical protein WEA09_04535 [Gemmatimonadota bacterium]
MTPWPPTLRPIHALLPLGLLLGACSEGPSQPAGDPPPQTVVLLATPKIISDFSQPDDDIASFLDHYAPLTTPAAKTIVIFGVGNSEHILQYRGPAHWDEGVEWARHIGFREPGTEISDQPLDYHQVARIVELFRSLGTEAGLNIKVYDFIDQGREFAYTNFKDNRHPECLDRNFEDAFNIRVPMRGDSFQYASAPNGIPEGTLCGHFLVDQVGHYVRDLGFDGILYKNQLGTRGHWLPGHGPGYSQEEADAIDTFLAYSREVLGQRELMWFDSYNNVQEERDTWSFPSTGYAYFDYLIASGFCVITNTQRYIDNLESKLELRDQVQILATLDYVDPWYDYNSMVEFADESRRLEDVAIQYRSRIDGVMLFANDEVGGLVPRHLLESFSHRFYLEG